MSKTKTIMISIFVGLLVAAIASPGWALTIAVIPSEYTNIDGPSEIGEPINGYNSASGQLVQYVIEANYLTGLQNQNLTGLTFRLDSQYAPALPEINYADFTIILSSWNGGTLSSTPSSNIVNGQVATSGEFAFAEGAFSTGGDPNGFGNFITFDTPYTYTSGDLLVTISHTQPIGGETASYWSVDAFAGAYSALIVHDADGINSPGTFWAYSPVTEFTTSPLNADGTTVVPEPTTLLLFGTGIVGLAGYTRRKNR